MVLPPHPALNGYFFYQGILEVIVLHKVLEEVRQKKQLFYTRMDSRRNQVKSLMRELEQDNLIAEL